MLSTFQESRSHPWPLESLIPWSPCMCKFNIGCPRALACLGQSWLVPVVMKQLLIGPPFTLKRIPVWIVNHMVTWLNKSKKICPSHKELWYLQINTNSTIEEIKMVGHKNKKSSPETILSFFKVIKYQVEGYPKVSSYKVQTCKILQMPHSENISYNLSKTVITSIWVFN